EFGRFLSFLTVVVLCVLGWAHMTKLGFGFSQFKENFREHALLCAAGLLFGWLLLDAASGYKEKLFFSARPGLFPRMELLAALAGPVFLVVLHQFRYFLNDGPANVAMAFGLLANLLFGGATNADVQLQGDAEASSLAAARIKFAKEGWSSQSLGQLASIHERLGNLRKVKLINNLKKSLNEGRQPQ
ncbi:MAG: hypothetical protein HY098_01635, partial [Nitrospinae bacterium]|nr:hypothetical protein [Nitrospinota bacterium]